MVSGPNDTQAEEETNINILLTGRGRPGENGTCRWCVKSCSFKWTWGKHSMADVVANQKLILANQKDIKANQKIIKDNQATILRNQGLLNKVLANQEKILALLKK